MQLVAPFAPHIAEELWERLGHKRSVFDSGWPSFDPALAAEDTIELVVQVNGKVRGRVRVARTSRKRRLCPLRWPTPQSGNSSPGNRRR